ncbi:hypothetical protein [Piscibacillus salipiscarius]|nr:hypothetical protein [Piscibacillus salipiscarius]
MVEGITQFELEQLYEDDELELISRLEQSEEGLILDENYYASENELLDYFHSNYSLHNRIIDIFIYNEVLECIDARIKSIYQEERDFKH